MKVYVLVKSIDEGEYDNRPTIYTRTFSALDAAKKAMKEEAEQFGKERELDYDTLEETETSYYCTCNEVMAYGFIPYIELKIIETELE